MTESLFCDRESTNIMSAQDRMRRQILADPDRYSVSTVKSASLMWIFDAGENKLIEKEIEFCPGLLTIFNGLLLNAVVHKPDQYAKTWLVKVNIDTVSRTISIWNNGSGIPCGDSKTIRRSLKRTLDDLTEFQDVEQIVDRFGYNAKLCNIFSEKFAVEISNTSVILHKTWTNNMSEASEPKFTTHGKKTKKESPFYSKIEFWPDEAIFGPLTDDIIGLLKRRVYDVSFVCRSVYSNS